MKAFTLRDYLAIALQEPEFRSLYKRELLINAIAKMIIETSRSSIDRLLDPENTAITLKTLARVATIVGKKLDIRFIN